MFAGLSAHNRVSLASVPLFFFFNDTATTEIYTLSLHDALPICRSPMRGSASFVSGPFSRYGTAAVPWTHSMGSNVRRSEEHTSELQSQSNLVCRLLLEKKNKQTTSYCDSRLRALTLACCRHNAH